MNTQTDRLNSLADEFNNWLSTMAEPLCEGLTGKHAMAASFFIETAHKMNQAFRLMIAMIPNASAQMVETAIEKNRRTKAKDNTSEAERLIMSTTNGRQL